MTPGAIPNVPKRHDVQFALDLEPIRVAKVPVGHVVQMLVPPVPYVPAVQFVQATLEEAPTNSPKVPA